MRRPVWATHPAIRDRGTQTRQPSCEDGRRRIKRYSCSLAPPEPSREGRPPEGHGRHAPPGPRRHRPPDGRFGSAPRIRMTTASTGFPTMTTAASTATSPATTTATTTTTTTTYAQERTEIELRNTAPTSPQTRPPPPKPGMRRPPLDICPDPATRSRKRWKRERIARVSVRLRNKSWSRPSCATSSLPASSAHTSNRTLRRIR